MYTGYVNNQHRETVKSLAQTAATNANAMVRRGAFAGLTDAQIAAQIKSALFLPSPADYDFTVSGNNVIVTEHNPPNMSASVPFRN